MSGISYFYFMALGSFINKIIKVPIAMPNTPIPLNVVLHPKFFNARILRDDKADPRYIPPF